MDDENLRRLDLTQMRAEIGELKELIHPCHSSPQWFYWWEELTRLEKTQTVLAYKSQTVDPLR